MVLRYDLIKKEKRKAHKKTTHRNINPKRDTRKRYALYRQNSLEGGYRAQAVTYTIAYLSYIIQCQNKFLDFNLIW